MKILLKFALIAIMALAGPTAGLAQVNPPTPAPFAVLGGSAALAVTNSSARVALPASITAYSALTVYNSGTVDAFIALGDVTITAAATGGCTIAGGPGPACLVRAGTAITVWVSTNTYLAAITASSTTTLTIYQATSGIQLSKAGGGTAIPMGAAGGDLSGTYPNPSVATYGGGSAFGTAASATIGTSGNTVPKNNTANVFSAQQTVNTNGTAAPSAITGAGVLVNGANATIARVQANSYGAIAAFTAARTNGTAASPTAVLSGDQIGGANAYAWGSNAAINGPITSFRTYAAENISGTAWGSKACMATSALTTTTLADGFCQQPSGGVTAGSPTGGDKGAGTVNVTGQMYQNGVPVSRPPTNFYTAGRWYWGAAGSIAATSAWGTAGLIRFQPIYISAPITISNIGARMAANSGANLQIAIYASDGTTGFPTGAPLASTSSILLTAGGSLSAAMSLSMTPGWYWVGFNTDSTATSGGGYATSSMNNGALVGADSQANLGTGTAPGVEYSFVGTFNTWPSSPAITVSTPGASPHTLMPAFQVSSVP